MSSGVPAVLAEGLRKRFGKTQALDGVDLEVPEGRVLGLLGPNGAGKTTAVRILSTLLKLDSGRATVAGFDVARQPEQVRYRIGLVGQHTAVDEELTGYENLLMFGRLYHLGDPTARRRAGELLEQFGLTESAKTPAKRYSGGMKRRLDLAASFIMAPQVLFLDEPTTGQDPRHRSEVWAAVRSLVAGGTTVLLTTHYLDEADQLSDRISVIDRGRVIAEGTPEQLKSRIGGDQIEMVLADAAQVGAAAELLARVTGEQPTTDPDTRRVAAPVADRVAALTETVRSLDAAGLTVADIGLRRPTLDEVFLRLTGRTAADAEAEATAGSPAGEPSPAGGAAA
jgi:ABC-2 type transport system ATP-binding protein